jgi:hypothetical protein
MKKLRHNLQQDIEAVSSTTKATTQGISNTDKDIKEEVK